MAVYSGNIDNSQATGAVLVSRMIRAEPRDIWEVIGSESGMKRWMGMHNFQPRKDGRVLMDTSGASEAERIIVVGRVTELRPEHEVCFTWRQMYEDFTGWPAETLLRLTLQPGEDGTQVTLEHSGFDKLGQFRERAYNVYHHCWVETPYMQRLEGASQA